jgi:enoyl-[acyl-carrier-protein] reductase (NADH)
MLSIFVNRDLRKRCTEFLESHQEVKTKVTQTLPIVRSMLDDLNDYIPEEVKIITKDSYILNVLIESLRNSEDDSDKEFMDILEKENVRLKEEISNYEVEDEEPNQS